MKVLVIPDVHLKPWIIDMAESIDELNYEKVVFLGDLVDDFGEQYNTSLYKETLDKINDFAHYHLNSYFCIGNHDYSYIHGLDETGYSVFASDIVKNKLEDMWGYLEDRVAVIQKIDNLIFSHAGLSKNYVENVRHYYSSPENFSPEVTIEEIMDWANSNLTPYDLWNDDSPIWTRNPLRKLDSCIKDSENLVQVIGHTPMRNVEKTENLIMTDVFSTKVDGTSYGEEELIIVDSITGEYDYAR